MNIMVLTELSKHYFDKEYYDRAKPKTDENKTQFHIQMNNELADELTKVVAVYRALNIEKRKITKSELIAVALTNLFKELEEDETNIYEITALLNHYRIEQGA